MNLSSFGELFKKSWEDYKKKIGGLAVLFAIPFVLNLIVALTGSDRSGLTLLLTLIAILVSLLVQIAVIFFLDSGETKADVNKLLSKSLPLALPMLIVSILVGLAVFGGLILLIVPGIVFAIWFSLSSFMLVLEDKRGTEALKASKAMVTGRTGAVFVRILLLVLSFLGIGIVTGIVLALFPRGLKDVLNGAVSSFVFAPLASVFSYRLYKDLKANKAPATAPAA